MFIVRSVGLVGARNVKSKSHPRFVYARCHCAVVDFLSIKDYRFHPFSFPTRSPPRRAPSPPFPSLPLCSARKGAFAQSVLWYRRPPPPAPPPPWQPFVRSLPRRCTSILSLSAAPFTFHVVVAPNPFWARTRASRLALSRVSPHPDATCQAGNISVCEGATK